MDYKNSLLKLGLNRNEIEVYTALLKRGLTQAGPLVKDTRLHRMIVYNALDKLVREDLATVQYRKKIQLFQPADPGVLTTKTERLLEMTQDLVPALRQIQGSSTDLVSVHTLVGQEGFIKNLQDLAESAAHQPNRTMCIIGGGTDEDFYEAIGDWYKDYVALISKKKVKKKLLAPALHSTGFRQNFAVEKGTELRVLPKGLSSPTYTRITEEMISFEIYHPKLVLIQIRNAAIAKTYLDSFNLLWADAKSK